MTRRQVAGPQQGPPRHENRAKRPDGPRPGLVSKLLVSAIGGYQQLRAGRPTGCRYIPSCSAYAEEAVLVHGPARGTLLALRRLARCHPLGGHGIDPVPDRSVTCRH